jgi:Superinfection immunity protein
MDIFAFVFFPFLFGPFFGFGFLVYFAPTIVALARHKRNTLSIFLLNLFLGWTLVGWIIALVWASTVDVPAPAR